MKVYLSNMCTSLVGLLNPELGYFLVKRKGGFFSQRSRWGVPRDGHWRFIVLCAELAQAKLHIGDIRVNGKEVYEALKEAGIDVDMYPFDFEEYNAKWVLDFKNKTGL